MKKPRIFINMHYMALGGAERALLGLLNALDTERVDVDLFLNQHTGEFMPFIPNNVNLIPERKGYNAIERPIRQILKERQFGIFAGRIIAKWKYKKYFDGLTREQQKLDISEFQYVANSVNPYLHHLYDLGCYDLAISFMQPHNIVLNKVNSKKKVAWIHTDYSTVHVDRKLEMSIWSGFDHIISISKDCTNAFLKPFPTLKDKIVEIENILSPTFVRTQARIPEETIIGKFKGVKLVSVGRICHAKNYDNIPYIAKILKHNGLIFKWFIIGPGNHSDIDNTIIETHTEDCIEFIGPKDNPYPFMRDCDVYVQPSRYEGKSVTVREAQILCKPVVVTNYTTANSQIENGVDGVIVPMDNEGCAQGIIDFMADKQLQQNITDYLKTHDFGNESEIEKIYNLL
ncbi:MAG: glycosyltransferase [Muribaculaceae bacterium]|nr:glycosyltransferase [Muribaculaceae bacterium]